MDRWAGGFMGRCARGLRGEPTAPPPSPWPLPPPTHLAVVVVEQAAGEGAAGRQAVALLGQPHRVHVCYRAVHVRAGAETAPVAALAALGPSGQRRLAGPARPHHGTMGAPGGEWVPHQGSPISYDTHLPHREWVSAPGCEETRHFQAGQPIEHTPAPGAVGLPFSVARGPPGGPVFPGHTVRGRRRQRSLLTARGGRGVGER